MQGLSSKQFVDKINDLIESLDRPQLLHDAITRPLDYVPNCAKGRKCQKKSNQFLFIDVK